MLHTRPYQVGHCIFEHRKGFLVRVSTIVFPEPQSYGILGAPDACYEGETCIFVQTGPGPGDWRLGHRMCHRRADRCEEHHARIAKRAMKHCRIVPTI